MYKLGCEAVMKVRDDFTLKGVIRLWRFLRESTPFRATFWEHLQRWVLYTGLVYKLGCEAAMKVRDDDTLEGAHSFVGFFRESPPFCATFWEHLQRWVLYTGLVYKLACKAAMKVRDDDTLEGAHSFVALFEGISPISRHFLGTLTEMGSIHWVGVQTWLRSSHEGKR